MGRIKIVCNSNSEPCNINWNNFSIRLPKKFSGTCHIYIDALNGDTQSDLDKISQINNIQGLEELQIYSKDFRVAEYFNLLLKDFKGIKVFNLLNDLEIRNRNEIDFSTLNYNGVTVPFDYIMYGIEPKGIKYYNLVNYRQDNIIKVNSNQQKAYPDIQDKVNIIIDEIFGQLPMEQLDEIDKNILVSNWIQKNIQFVEGKISNAGGKRFICDEFEATDMGEDIMTVLNKRFGMCNAIAKLSVALLSNPRVGCKCNYAHSPGHAYFTQIIDDVTYITDNTWSITRNPNRMNESLKAAAFSDKYILIGEDKISEDDDTLVHHTRDGIFKGAISKQGIPRERINQSIEKLKTLGVDFSYKEPPIFVQHEESQEQEI